MKKRNRNPKEKRGEKKYPQTKWRSLMWTRASNISDIPNNKITDNFRSDNITSTVKKRNRTLKKREEEINKNKHKQNGGAVWTTAMVIHSHVNKSIHHIVVWERGSTTHLPPGCTKASPLHLLPKCCPGTAASSTQHQYFWREDIFSRVLTTSPYLLFKPWSFLYEKTELTAERGPILRLERFPDPSRYVLHLISEERISPHLVWGALQSAVSVFSNRRMGTTKEIWGGVVPSSLMRSKGSVFACLEQALLLKHFQVISVGAWHYHSRRWRRWLTVMPASIQRARSRLPLQSGSSSIGCPWWNLFKLRSSIGRSLNGCSIMAIMDDAAVVLTCFQRRLLLLLSGRIYGRQDFSNIPRSLIRN